MPDRVSVRLRQSGLVAVRVTEPRVLDLADGHDVPAKPGDWLITKGAQTLRVVPAMLFARDYEPIIPAQLTLTAADCGALEDRLGLGTTESVTKLLAAIDRLAAIKVGDVRIPFTPGQLAELQHRAAKRGRTVEAEMRAVVSRLEEELFYKGG
jgi:hypothetical protein